jgi:DNA polymerase-3 subunit gamma/tau
MALLRMLAFTPSGNDGTPGRKVVTPVAPSAPVEIPRSTVAKPVSAPESVASAMQAKDRETAASSTEEQILDRHFDGDWRSLVDNLKLGLARALAQNCELVRHEDNAIYLSVPEAQKHLLEASSQEKLRTAIAQYFGRKMQLHFDIGGSGNTPAQQRMEEKAALQSQAESAIREDDFVQALVKDFGAQIIPSSIKPI